ncbi:hypothetical protein [Nocardia sp. NPDC003183]
MIEPVVPPQTPLQERIHGPLPVRFIPRTTDPEIIYGFAVVGDAGRVTDRDDYIWGRVSESLPWVATQGVTAHWLRHTTLTWVERTFSYAVARTFAGHRGKNSGTTDTYVKSYLDEVAAALAVLTGEPHPLARGVGHPAATVELGHRTI